MKIRLLEPENLRAPGTGRRRVVVGVALWAVVLTGVVWAVVLAGPCDFYWAAEVDACDASTVGIVQLIQDINFLGSYLTVLFLYVRVVIRAARLGCARVATPGDRAPSVTCLGSASGPLTTTSHWTAAASSDVFFQVSRTLRKLRVSIAPFMFVQPLASVLSLSVSLAAGNPASSHSELGVNSVCPKGVNLCRVAWFGDVLVFSVNIALLIYLLVVTVLSYDVLWSPVTLAAIKQTRDWRMARMRQLPFCMLFPMAMDFCILLNYAVFDPTKVPASQYAVFFANCVVVLYLMGALSWMFCPWGAPAPTFDASDGYEMATDLHTPSETTTNRTLCQAWGERLRLLLRTGEGGVRVQREALLFVLATLFTQKETFERYHRNPALVAVEWTMRLSTFLAVVLTRDEEAGFHTLSRTGAAFGLVVDASDLEKALSHTLRHRRPSSLKVRTYKGSLMRIQQTMSVSYRWQEVDQPIAAGLRLNMSTWQQQNLHDAIVDTNCKYVWIDRISVPQSPGTLQQTLLSRMMAVYAASGCTLVLRSRETDGSRYHQRGWTVQEFCSCSKAAVRTEPATPEAVTPHSGVSVHTSASDSDEDEGRYFHALREWHIARAQHCIPLWLRKVSTSNPVSESTLETAVLTFIDLSSRVSTSKPMDLVRALVPMLANCPVETQGELVELLKLLDAKANSPSFQNQVAMHATRAADSVTLPPSVTVGSQAAGFLMLND